VTVRTGFAVPILFTNETCVAVYAISAGPFVGGGRIMSPEDDVAPNAPEEV